MMRALKHICTFLFFISFTGFASARALKAGFDKAEYIELLKLSARQGDTPWTRVNQRIDQPGNYVFAYRSPTMGLENRWDLWLNDKAKIAVLSIRGTTANTNSWLANFYAAMVPATGELYLTSKDTFRYKLADNPKAAVHVGWLIGMASLSDDIVHKVDSCYANGYRDFIIMGHSQGGAIAYMLRSYMAQLQREAKLSADITWKTYCSAAPKPGNLYYAYDYEALTQNGWGFTVVNTADWVPETPLSLQTVRDFNNINPFNEADAAIKKRSFAQRMIAKMLYNQLRRPANKLQRRYVKYLGKGVYKMVIKNLKEYKQPAYANTSNYMRAGTPVILKADEAYYRNYPDVKEKMFAHHFMGPYLYLAERYSD